MYDSARKNAAIHFIGTWGQDTSPQNWPPGPLVTSDGQTFFHDTLMIHGML
jgi:hypothetical protein